MRYRRSFIQIYDGNWSVFWFSKYLGNIPIFFWTKFSPPRLKTFRFFFIFCFSFFIRLTDSQPALSNKYGRYGYIDIGFLYVVKCNDIDSNILVATTPNIDSAKLFTLSFIRLRFTFSLSSYINLVVTSNERYFLFCLIVVRKSTTGQRFLHLDLVSYQDCLRNPI